MSGPIAVSLVVCPECGFTYPPGSVLSLGEGVLDAVVEAGGQSLHPKQCSRSEAFGQSASVGLFQTAFR